MFGFFMFDFRYFWVFEGLNTSILFDFGVCLLFWFISGTCFGIDLGFVAFVFFVFLMYICVYIGCRSCFVAVLVLKIVSELCLLVFCFRIRTWHGSGI